MPGTLPPRAPDLIPDKGNVLVKATPHVKRRKKAEPVQQQQDQTAPKFKEAKGNSVASIIGKRLLDKTPFGRYANFFQNLKNSYDIARNGAIASRIIKAGKKANKDTAHVDYDYHRAMYLMGLEGKRPDSPEERSQKDELKNRAPQAANPKPATPVQATQTPAGQPPEVKPQKPRAKKPPVATPQANPVVAKPGDEPKI